MPDQRLKRLSMRCNVLRINNRNHDTGVSNLRCETAVAADNAAKSSAYLISIFQSSDQVRADVAIEVAPAYGENQDHVLVTKATDLQPVRKSAIPAVVVDPRR